MTIRILDCETTTFQSGNPNSRRNRLCSVGLLDVDSVRTWDIEYSLNPYGDSIAEILDALYSSTLIVGFNLKFDLKWMMRYGLDVRRLRGVWDCQLAEFLLSNQKWKYPDLQSSCDSWGIAGKSNVVDSTYWSNGVDTPDIPWDVLDQYLRQDLECTYNLYQKQRDIMLKMDPRLLRLFRAQCIDLLCLAEAEMNGQLIDVSKSRELERTTSEELANVEEQLAELVGERRINWGSPKHVSSVLYGGQVAIKTRVPTERLLKNGTVKHGEKWGFEYVEFKGLVKPIRGSESGSTKQLSEEDLQGLNAERATSGKSPVQRVFSTDAATLKSLKPTSKRGKEVLGLLLKRAELDQLVSMYYKGLPDKIEEYDWDEGKVYGQFNQVTVTTGRLSSSEPNLQNIDRGVKELFYSRF